METNPDIRWKQHFQNYDKFSNPDSKAHVDKVGKVLHQDTLSMP
jgi:hypothetical protein